MNTTPRNQRPSRKQAPAPAPLPSLESSLAVEDFADLSQQAEIVEHLTIPGFLRRIPHRWHLDEITRFGDKVGRAAESLQLAYLTTVDRSLGVIRVFPLPLMKRVYDLLAPQFGWPRILEAEVLTLEDGRRVREALRTSERLARNLQEMVDTTESAPVLEALSVVMGHVDSQLANLRARVVEDGAAANPRV